MRQERIRAAAGTYASQSAQTGKLIDLLPESRWLAVFLVALIAEMLFQIFVAPPTPDEAYYWLWGQRLALSYFDHPPLLAWLQRLSAELFGWNLFALRAVSLATFCGSLSIIWYWSGRYLPGQSVRLFLAGSVTWLSIPMLMHFQSFAHQDPLLMFLGLVTAHFFALFHESLDGPKFRWEFFLAGSVALGLAGLTKYNAVFFGLGFAAFVVFSRKGQPLLKDWRLWAGAGIAVAMQAPVLIWNAQNHWLSFQYNLDDRIGREVTEGFITHLIVFVVGSFFQFSPYFLVGLFRLLTGKGPVQTPFGDIGKYVFLLSTITFLLLCLKNWVLPYWNIPAYVFALPVISLFMKNRWHVIAHAVYGTVVGAALVFAIYTFPIYPAFGWHSRDADIMFGWPTIAGILAKEEAEFKPDMIMTTDYRTASMLAFAAKRLDIEKIGLRSDQYDLWFHPAAHKGQNALVLVDDFLPETELVTKVFRKVTHVRDIEITKFGNLVHTYRLVWAEDYSGAGPH